MPSNRRLLATLLPVLLLCAVNQSMAELQVEGKPKWGYDGTIHVEDFNLLTVEIFNNSEKPWQGSLWVNPIVGIQAVDVPVIQPDLFIEPYGNRVVQFYVFVPDRTEYEFAWGQIRSGRFFAEDQVKIDSPRVSREQLTIQLVNPDFPVRSPDLPTFDEQYFPSSAIVLNPVQAIVLDHIPRWQNPQIQAFRDWLYDGGTLYLLSSDSATLLEFPTSLSELNEPSDSFPIGYGKVVRTKKAIKPERKPQQQNQNNYKNLSTAGTIHTILKAMTTPDHNWSLIYFMAVVYLLILFPGCWLIGRKKGDYRMTYTVVLGTVALFSFGFHSVGKRGYGEETTINSVALVRPAQPGRWQVKQWSNLFITDGDNYFVEHPVDSSAISTGQHTERVRGLATNQPSAVMQTDIPAFSNRTVVHAGILKNEGFRPQVSSLEVKNGQLDKLVLSLPDGQSWPLLESMFAFYGNRMYQLQFAKGKIHKVGNPQQPTQLDYNSLTYRPYGWRSNESQASVVDLYEKTSWLMIADDLGLFNGEMIAQDTLPAGTVRVYLSQEMDESFFAAGDISPQQQGKVMYTFDFRVDDQN